MQGITGIHDYHELAEVLTEQYNEYVQVNGSLPLLNSGWVADIMKDCLDGDDLESLVDNEYARGLAMGQILNIYLRQHDGDENEQQEEA